MIFNNTCTLAITISMKLRNVYYVKHTQPIVDDV